MAPKCAMSALPPPRDLLEKSMLEMGAEVDLDGLRAYAVRHGNVLVHDAFNAYHRQLMNWWPDTLLTRYNELPRTKGADDARRQCLTRYLLNPSSGGFPADQPGVCAEDGDGSPLAKVRRVGDAGNGGVATPAQDTPIKCTPMQAFTPRRSPAVLLATSVRSTGTPRIQLSPEPAQTDRRWAEVPWS